MYTNSLGVSSVFPATHHLAPFFHCLPMSCAVLLLPPRFFVFSYDNVFVPPVPRAVVEAAPPALLAAGARPPNKGSAPSFEKP